MPIPTSINDDAFDIWRVSPSGYWDRTSHMYPASFAIGTNPRNVDTTALACLVADCYANAKEP